jgi:hypothetical protein
VTPAFDGRSSDWSAFAVHSCIVRGVTQRSAASSEISSQLLANKGAGAIGSHQDVRGQLACARQFGPFQA